MATVILAILLAVLPLAAQQRQGVATATARLEDPGKGKSAAQAASARQKAWARKATKAERDADRDARISVVRPTTPAVGEGIRPAAGTTYLVFPDRSTAQQVLHETCVLPLIDGDTSSTPLIVWWEPERTENGDIGTVEGADGRVIVGDWRWGELQLQWLAAQWPKAFVVVDKWPADWKPMLAQR